MIKVKNIIKQYGNNLILNENTILGIKPKYVEKEEGIHNYDEVCLSIRIKKEPEKT